MAVLGIYPAFVIRGVRGLGRKARRAPARVAEVSCTGGCTRTRSLLSWTNSSLAAGGSVSYQVTVKAAQPGKALLLGAAASRNPDPHLLNNVAFATINVKR
jgi:hypothetical protein